MCSDEASLKDRVSFPPEGVDGVEGHVRAGCQVLSAKLKIISLCGHCAFHMGNVVMLKQDSLRQNVAPKLKAQKSVVPRWNAVRGFVTTIDYYCNIQQVMNLFFLSTLQGSRVDFLLWIHWCA